MQINISQSIFKEREVAWKLKKHIITDDYYYTKTRDRIGGTIRTNVFKNNGIYEAFSIYWQDKEEEIVGYAKAYDDEQAAKQSRKNLRKEWKEEQERIATSANEEDCNIVAQNYA